MATAMILEVENGGKGLGYIGSSCPCRDGSCMSMEKRGSLESGQSR